MCASLKPKAFTNPPVSIDMLRGQNSKFGMLYEKTVFSNLVRRLVAEHRIRNVCEYPTNDLMGDNNQEFEKLGCQVKKLRQADRTSGKFDLVWNFCEFERSQDPLTLVEEMKELSNAFMLIITQNKTNVMLFHRWYHFIKRRRW
ncbi:MAG: hypothetical protein JSV58_02040, partial [Candidatus Bathyarchaeota archaeon]